MPPPPHRNTERTDVASPQGGPRSCESQRPLLLIFLIIFCGWRAHFFFFYLYLFPFSTAGAGL